MSIWSFVFQDMASFKISALQKALEESVPQADLDKVNKEYHQLTEKYRDLLEKGNTLVSKVEAITGLEVRLCFSSQYFDLHGNCKFLQIWQNYNLSFGCST